VPDREKGWAPLTYGNLKISLHLLTSRNTFFDLISDKVKSKVVSSKALICNIDIDSVNKPNNNINDLTKTILKVFFTIWNSSLSLFIFEI
jgi:hypothetical protein